MFKMQYKIVIRCADWKEVGKRSFQSLSSAEESCSVLEKALIDAGITWVFASVHANACQIEENK